MTPLEVGAITVPIQAEVHVAVVPVSEMRIVRRLWNRWRFRCRRSALWGGRRRGIQIGSVQDRERQHWLDVLHLYARIVTPRVREFGISTRQAAHALEQFAVALRRNGL